MDTWTPVQKTLTIPLMGRALARELFPELGFSDPAAEQLARGLDPALAAGLKKDGNTIWGSIRRTMVFDQITREFLSGQSRGVVLNLGGGFCTRRARLGIDASQWIEVDFAEVIREKLRLLPSENQVTFVEGSLAHAETIRLALQFVGDRPCLVIAEGVLMFLRTDETLGAFSVLEQRLPPGSELVFDYIHPWVRRLSRVHPSLKLTGAVYDWATRSPRWIAAALPRLELVSDNAFTREYTGRMRLLDRALRRVMGGFALYDVARMRVRRGGTA